MIRPPLARGVRRAAAVLALATLSACSALQPSAAPQTAFYTLDGPAITGTAPAADAPVLTVNSPHAAAGFDSPRMIYVRETHKLEHFAGSAWIDPPARMLTPLLVAALESTGAFRAVVQKPGAASGELRLDTEIIRLQQDFRTLPGHARFTLRAYLVEEKTRRALAWREFDAAVPVSSEDPRGGVVAANRAVQLILEKLAIFCAGEARSLQFAK